MLCKAWVWKLLLYNCLVSSFYGLLNQSIVQSAAFLATCPSIGPCVCLDNNMPHFYAAFRPFSSHNTSVIRVTTDIRVKPTWAREICLHSQILSCAGRSRSQVLQCKQWYTCCLITPSVSGQMGFDGHLFGCRGTPHASVDIEKMFIHFYSFVAKYSLHHNLCKIVSALWVSIFSVS